MLASSGADGVPVGRVAAAISLVRRGIVGISRAVALVPPQTSCVGSASVCHGLVHRSAEELLMRFC